MHQTGARILAQSGRFIEAIVRLPWAASRSPSSGGKRNLATSCNLRSFDANTEGSHHHTPKGRQSSAGVPHHQDERRRRHSVSLGDSGAGGSENVSLAFAKVDLEYKPQKADGSLDAGVHFKFDIKSNKGG
jgi:hypothetical protein